MWLTSGQGSRSEAQGLEFHTRAAEQRGRKIKEYSGKGEDQGRRERVDKVVDKGSRQKDIQGATIGWHRYETKA